MLERKIYAIAFLIQKEEDVYRLKQRKNQKFKRGRKTKIKSLPNQLYKKHEMRRDQINLLSTKMLLICELCGKKANKQTN